MLNLLYGIHKTPLMNICIDKDQQQGPTTDNVFKHMDVIYFLHYHAPEPKLAKGETTLTPHLHLRKHIAWV